MVDAGKTVVMIRADQVTLDQALRFCERLSHALTSNNLGIATATQAVDFEPFTSGSEQDGLKWIRVELDLDQDVELKRLVALLASAGIPTSSHLMYTDRMRLSGSTLSECM